MNRRFSRPSFGTRRYFSRRFEAPVKVGEEFNVEIEEMGSKGDGIARVKNFVIFVPNTNQGDRCRIKITRVSNRFAIAEKIGEGAEPVKKPGEKKEEAEKPEKPEEKEEKAEKPKEKKKEPEKKKKETKKTKQKKK